MRTVEWVFESAAITPFEDQERETRQDSAIHSVGYSHSELESEHSPTIKPQLRGRRTLSIGSQDAFRRAISPRTFD